MRTVLIADDDSDLLKLYSQAFSNNFFEVHPAQDLQEVEKLTNSSKFDVIILDLLFPSADSLPVIRLIREEGSVNKNTPIILLTNLDTKEKITEALKAGANETLLKAEQTPSGIVKTALKYVEGKTT